MIAPHPSPANPADSDPTVPAGSRGSAARLLLAGWLPLLAVLVMAWPLPGILERDPFPLRTGAGLALLLSIPATLYVLWRRSTELPRAILWLAIPLGITLLGIGVTDHSEQLRAAVLLASAVLLFACGASLSSQARAWFARGSMGLSVLFTGGALLGHMVGADSGLSGTLGNTGSLSQAALPGAAIALTWGLGRGGGTRVLAAACAGSFLAHAWMAPVLAGAVALATALLVLVRRDQSPGGSQLPAIALLPLLALLAPPSEESQDATGGIAVRQKLWATLPAIVAEHPLGGLGPGQFQAAYPPYRDPAEIELSTHERLLGEEIVVEHLHNDWLQGFAEWGVLGGSAWVIFLALIAFSALFGRQGTTRNPARGAALAMCAAALFHSPLLSNPASSLQAFALFGMLAADSGKARLLKARWPWELNALALLAALPAWLILTSGRALVPATGDEGANAGVSANSSISILPSAEGHAILARWLSARGTGPYWGGTPAEHWDAVLAMRPYQTEALLNAGVQRIRKDDVNAARDLWQRVLDVDAAHPRALRNLARLEFSSNRPDVGLSHALRLSEDGRLTADFTLELATEALLRGEVGPALALIHLGDGQSLQRVPEASPELFQALAGEHETDERLSDALRMNAQHLWGLEHAAAGNFRQAAISLRQAHGLARRHTAPAIVRLTLELAASEHLVGRTERARDLLGELAAGTPHPPVADFAHAPLAELGVAIRLDHPRGPSTE